MCLRGATVRIDRTVVTGSRGLPSALPAHLPQGTGGLRRYEPVGRSESLRSGASFWLTRQGISLFALLNHAIERVALLKSRTTPACRHADGTISSSETRADVRRMVSEDSARISAIGLSC